MSSIAVLIIAFFIYGVLKVELNKINRKSKPKKSSKPKPIATTKPVIDNKRNQTITIEFDQPEIKEPNANELLELNVRYPDYKFENGVDIIIKKNKTEIRAYGLAKYDGGHLVIAFDYQSSVIKYFKLSRFRNCINAETGEIITSIKDFMLNLNPDIFDIRPEFNRLDELKMKHGLI